MNDLPQENRPDDGEGAIFGLFIGLFAGAATGMFCSWFLHFEDEWWLWGAIGAGLGAIGGLAVGLRLGQARGDIATQICLVYSVLPALLILLCGLGVIRGRLSGMIVLGAMFACPMSAMLVGAIFDRMHDRVRARRDALERRPQSQDNP